jgi:hypothetical protein
VTETDVHTVSVANQAWGGSGPSGWSRLPSGDRAGVVAAGLLLVVFVALLTVGAAMDRSADLPAPAAPTASAAAESTSR